MAKSLSRKLLELPGVLFLIRLLKSIIVPGFEGLSVYDLGHKYISGIINGAFSMRASAISFSAFTALFPFLLFLLNLIPYVPVENFQEEFLKFTHTLLPPKTSDFFDTIIFDIVNNKRGGLLSSTFALSMIFMANGVNAVFSGFRNSFHTKISRGLINQWGVAFGVAIILALLLITTVGVTLYVTYLVTHYERYFFGDIVFWLKISRLIFFVVMIFITMSLLFYFGTKEGKITRFFSPGSILTTVLIIITTSIFGFYIDNFSRYNEIYGSIGAILILMFYIWINSNLVLLGYELNASLRKIKH